MISATYALGQWDDVVSVRKLADKIQLLLTRYGGAVKASICHLFTSAAPRTWHRPGDQSNWIAAWVLGGDHVIEWLLHFGQEHGLSRGDLDRFASPNWLRAAIPSPPSWPPLPRPRAHSVRGLATY